MQQRVNVIEKQSAVNNILLNFQVIHSANAFVRKTIFCGAPVEYFTVREVLTEHGKFDEDNLRKDEEE